MQGTNQRKTDISETDRLPWKRRGGRQIMRENIAGNGVCYFTFPVFEEIENIVHGCSTRLGGVSTGDLYSMNLSFTRGDTEENVRENYRRIGEAVGFSPENITATWQTHTNHVRVVTEEDRGKGFLKERDYRDVDGLVTNVPGIVLAVFSADCVPVFAVDPVRQAVGLVHSGWKGTLHDIAGIMIRTMQKEYGSDPSDIYAAIAPSICVDCYEVSRDVAEQFMDYCVGEVREKAVLPGKREGKYQLDLHAVCKWNLEKAGVPADQISVTDICTCCNPPLLFSHRAQGEKRGNMASFLGIRKNPGGSGI